MSVATQQWSISNLPSFQSRNAQELDVLWQSEFPPTREADPALWDTLLGFFEDAIVSYCGRPGHLVCTPRELLKALKRQEREPFCGTKVIEELFRKGDLMSAGTLDEPSENDGKTQAGSAGVGMFNSLRRYLWSSTAKSDTPGPEDELVPTAALGRLAEEATRLVGPIATAEVHTLKSLANAITGGVERDAEAVAAYLVSQGKATVLRTTPTRENPTVIVGIRLGPGGATEADRSLLSTKAARERLVDVVAHLEQEVEVQKKEAVKAAKSGNKAGALSRIQRKAALEKKLSGAQASLRKLNDILLAVDAAESNRDSVAAIEAGVQSLRYAQEAGATADRVDDVAAQLDELLGQQEDLRLALEQIDPNRDQELIEAEEKLAELLAEDQVKELDDPALKAPEKLPSDAKEAAIKNKEKTAEQEAEEELARLMAETGITETTQEKSQQSEENATSREAQPLA